MAAFCMDSKEQKTTMFGYLWLSDHRNFLSEFIRTENFQGQIKHTWKFLPKLKGAEIMNN